MDVADAKRLRALKEENGKLQKLLAEQMPDNVALKEVLSRKVVGPTAREEVVGHLVMQGFVSERRASQLFGVSRTAVRYQSQRPVTDAPVKARMLILASQYPRCGYLMLHGLMKIPCAERCR